MKKNVQKRIFIGILPPERVISTLCKSIAGYKTEDWAKDVKWVRRENLHLTLKFIGTIDTTHLDRLVAATASVLTSVKPFGVQIAGLNIFPKPSRPSVICAGTSENKFLSSLAQAIEEPLHHAGYHKEKKGFKGHITLGRCKKSFPRSQKITDLIQSDFFQVNEIIVFQSILKPDGPEYIIEKRLQLR